MAKKKNPAIRSIEVEASRLAALDGNSSLKERFELRNQLRSEAGLSAEKRKLGGAAGVVDRNRNSVGNLAKNVAPFLSLIPAVGPIASGLVSAGGRAIQKGANLGSIVKSGVSGAAMGGGLQGAQAGLAGSAGKGLGTRALAVGRGALKGAANPFAKSSPSALPETLPAGTDAPWEVGENDTPLGLPGGLPSESRQNVGILGGIGGIARKLTGGGNLLDAGMLGLAGQQMLASGAASKRSQGFANKAIGLAEDRWKEGAPLRTAGQSGLLTSDRANLSSTFADPTNPFATASPVPQPVAPAPSPIPAPTAPAPTTPPIGGLAPRRVSVAMPDPVAAPRGGAPLPRRVR